MQRQSTSQSADVPHRPRLNRSRWAAIGAAIAVSLGAGGFGLANATVSTGEQPIYIAISPCRLADTRPDFSVGSRLTAFGPNETVTLTGTGAQGNCNVPSGVSALVLNVTALNATAPTYLQIAPGTIVTPGGASSLNPVPGEPPTPNAVTTPIDDAGKFSIYNLAGTVDVIVDIVGYYDDHEHTGADIVDESLASADIVDEPGLSYTEELDVQAVSSFTADYASVKINAPASGFVAVDVAAQVTYSQRSNPDNLVCGLDTSDDSVGTASLAWTNTDTAAFNDTINLHRTFEVDQGPGVYYLNCRFVGPGAIIDPFLGGAGALDNITMTAMYVPTWRGDLLLELPILPIVMASEPESTDG